MESRAEKQRLESELSVLWEQLKNYQEAEQR